MRHFVAILFAALVISLMPCRTPPVKTLAYTPQNGVQTRCPTDPAADCAARRDRGGSEQATGRHDLQRS